ncbi:multiple monosaccharide ABC transporter substrate-binding protein [Evansella cellulosilytica]|uniref:Periplasmic binding protein/LacI transcriptional regulator n=1 Tax=Evansella cellulosilytica (strain ATCC 21833 / DSM 2522 / FERM P-1141 / JCM 9156 / N-4) TaxID=649639 RepID=E6TRV0_EVAC2|nr:multiple monosaccharide ABC transporter substrate-binding protein [Evansella cellulosilytica]ADU29473.1 periplasmic binding protein/LacI transcriptional regulator [Evansella cellulosilytica DSM 2522]
MKKILLLLFSAMVLVALVACGDDDASTGDDGDSSGDSNGLRVGLALPTQSSERWVLDGDNMKKEFEALGYEVDMQFAEDVVETQVSQIENMITQGADILVIASIDGEALTSVLEMAEASDIPVIAYDRLIMNSEHVSYYATFDNFQVGVLQGEYIVENLGLTDGEEGPFNIELFAGSPDDNNAYFFWDGAMSVLQPYIDGGQLVVKSGQTNFEQGATLRWDGSLAQERMDNILSAHYSDATVDAVYSPFDGISRGIISSLTSVGYGSDSQPIPLITGQDAELSSVKYIISGEQTQTIFKDTRELAKQAVNMADAIMNDEEPEVNDTETYDNNAKVVPSYLIEPISVDIDNYYEVLVESGYFTEEDLD